jgi:hypothetical protein
MCDGVGRVTRNWIVVFRADRRWGRSWSVFTVHRSPPHADAVAALLGCVARAAEVARAAATRITRKNRCTMPSF